MELNMDSVSQSPSLPLPPHPAASNVLDMELNMDSVSQSPPAASFTPKPAAPGNVRQGKNYIEEIYREEEARQEICCKISMQLRPLLHLQFQWPRILKYLLLLLVIQKWILEQLPRILWIRLLISMQLLPLWPLLHLQFQRPRNLKYLLLLLSFVLSMDVLVQPSRNSPYHYVVGHLAVIPYPNNSVDHPLHWAWYQPMSGDFESVNVPGLAGTVHLAPILEAEMVKLSQTVLKTISKLTKEQQRDRHLVHS
ncbi:hypothetical protein BT96DRAFT_947144 [Gymnopus androsaceus JB14]|uniref:Uncharacterized protein n=1 Tax=Gymnopus androsaceus JB14 TaxID=1447944 RepID=A0A6A4GUP7_9AGAR|nr:hypothetical protein BT96DRAFT_947144 [Gymnopus androsaceus JB14]